MAIGTWVSQTFLQKVQIAMQAMRLFTKIIALTAAFLSAEAAFGQIQPSWTNNDPNHQTRFDTAAGADAKRQQLVNWVWSDGLPATLPSATDVPLSSFPADLQGNYQPINQTLVDGVVKLDANVSNMDFHSISYLLHPKNAANANRLVIVHQGHFNSAHALDCGIGNTANAILQAGYSVLLMQMPACGWNTDRTIRLSGGQTITISGVTGHAHDNMFSQLVPLIGTGAVYRFFMEPIVQDINYFRQCVSEAGDVSMIGLSGGGWTTAMAPAVDQRIKLSIPVAGSAPLYSRLNDPQHVCVGDSEQYQEPLYNENIKQDGSGGGICTYLEMYALGGFGADRRQIMLTNLRDPSCFAGDFPDSFKSIVHDLVANKLQEGSWEHVYDTTHSEHQISPWAINNVILPALAVPEPSTSKLTAVGILALGSVAWCRRRAPSKSTREKKKCVFQGRISCQRQQ